MPISLKSSVNLFLNHQNLMTSGIFRRVVLSLLPQILHVRVHCLCKDECRLWLLGRLMLQGELSSLTEEPRAFLFAKWVRKYECSAHTSTTVLNRRPGTQCRGQDRIRCRPARYGLLGDTRALVKKLVTSLPEVSAFCFIDYL